MNKHGLRDTNEFKVEDLEAAANQARLKCVIDKGHRCC